MNKLDALNEVINHDSNDHGLEGLEHVNFSMKEENRTKRMQVMLKPSEYETFIKLIGRKSESNATRELILDFLKANKQ